MESLGKVMEFYDKFFVGTLYTMLESARCIDISRYLSRDSYRDTLGHNFDVNFFFFF